MTPGNWERVPLTPLQRDVLCIIVEWVEVYGEPPTITELMAEAEIESRGNMHKLLCVLHEKGWVHVAPSTRRGITILHKPVMPTFDDIFALPIDIDAVAAELGDSDDPT